MLAAAIGLLGRETVATGYKRSPSVRAWRHDAIVAKRLPREMAGVSVLENGDLERLAGQPSPRGRGSHRGTQAGAPVPQLSRGYEPRAQGAQAKVPVPHDGAVAPTSRGSRFQGAEGWELGYEVDSQVARSGRHSARCSSGSEAEQHGIFFVVALKQKRPIPIRAECWSKARDVTGSADAGYSLYLDITYADGTPLWGQVRPFFAGTHGWEKAAVTVMPAKPIREVRVHGLLRGHRGEAWFDDFALWELRPHGKWSVFDRVLVEEVGPGIAARTRLPQHRAAPQTGAMNRILASRGPASARPRDIAEPASPRLCRPSGGSFDRLRTSYATSLHRAAREVTIARGGVRLALEAATGRVMREGRVGGLYLRDVAADSDFRQPLGRVTRIGGGARFRGEDRQLGLAIEADYELKPDYLVVRGKVIDSTGRDRAVTVYFALPLDARGWRWGDTLRRDETIGAAGDYQVTVDVAGGTGRMARWPFAAVYPGAPQSGSRARPGAGWAIAYPLDLPRINRVGYNAASRELYAAVDLGLSGETARFPHEASFEFALYRFDAAWGMRSALKRYYEIFPAAFVKRVAREGMWMPFTDISTVQGWQDFRFAFHEGTNNVPFDTAHGIYSFEYVEPVSYWMAMPTDVPRTREAAQALLREKAQAAPDMSYAAATYSSIVHDANGQPVMHLLKAPWCDGALSIVNPAPSVPTTGEFRVNKAQVMFHDIAEAMKGARWPLLQWLAWDRGFTVERGAGPGGEAALRCENRAGESSGASQTVILNPPRQARLTARAWSKADRVTDPQGVDYSLYIDLTYADGTSGYAFVAPFRPGTHDWELAEVHVDPPKPVAQVHFHMLLRSPHTGRAWFARPELRMSDGSVNLLANPGFAVGAGPAPAVSGTYVDSMEMGSEYLDFRREHWRDARVPLVFDPANGRCAQALIFGTHEFVQECARRMHERGRLMFANGALWRYIQFAPLLDVMGTETNWLADGELRPEPDELMMLRRALCYHKPYCLLMNSDYTKFPREYTERYFKRCLFYGIFPGFFSHNAADAPYWATPSLYERDRELFKRYMPLIQEIARAGWEPLTWARSDDPRVYVERYGPKDGAIYFTVMNSGERSCRTRVTADMGALRFARPTAMEALSGRAVPLQRVGATALFQAELAPEEVWVVRVRGQGAESRDQ